MPARNLAAEQKAIDIFSKTRGRLPSTPQDWAAIHKMSYPSDSELPEELKKTSAYSYYAGTGSNPAPSPSQPGTPIPSAPNTTLPQSAAGSSIGQLAKNVQDSTSQVQALSSPNEALRILQEAIRAKADTKNAPIGESEIFKKANVNGIGALSSSLQARGAEFAANQTEFNNIIGQMAGTYQDMAKMATFNYTNSINAYNKEVERLQAILDEAKKSEQEVKLIYLQHQLAKELEDLRQTGAENLAEKNIAAQKELENFKRLNPTIGEQTTALEKGFSIDDGVVSDPKKGIISGFDFNGYAANTSTHVRAVNGLLQGIGKFKTIEDVDKYIKDKYPNSPITGQMISNASAKYHVPWEVLVALIEHESMLGTSNVAKNNNNYGGATWNKNYELREGASIGTPRPAAEGGNYVKFETPQAGVDEIAAILDRRRVGDAYKSGDVLTEEQAKAVKELRTEFNTQLEKTDFPVVARNYNIIQDLKQTVDQSTGLLPDQGDATLLFSVMKILSPDSNLRPGVGVDTLADPNSVLGQAQTLWNRIVAGEDVQLNKEQVSGFIKQAELVYNSRATEVKPLVEFYSNQAKKQGLNPSDIVGAESIGGSVNQSPPPVTRLPPANGPENDPLGIR